MKKQNHCVKINVAQFCADLEYTLMTPFDGDFFELRCGGVDRTGLCLAGCYGTFNPERIQVAGGAESEYLNSLSKQERTARCEEFFKKEFPFLVLSEGQCVDELIEAAKKEKRAVVRGNLSYDDTVERLKVYLESLFEGIATVHGALVDVFGIGVLITGESGIGKSETALELLQRGHRLVADDAVFFRREGGNLVGSAPEIVRHMMEIRGIGIINVQEMYGSGAVKLSQELDLVIRLEEWDDAKDYSRAKSDSEQIHLLNFEKLTVPVKPGRNIASIIEVAVKNFRLKHMGLDAAEELRGRCKV